MSAAVPARARRWAGALLGTLADQGLFSGANFLMNLLLARWLEPSAYGSFSVAFNAFLLLAGFHGALVLEPMSVRGARRDPASGYVSGLVRLHFVLTVPVSVLLAAVAATVVPPGSLRAAGLGLALAFPFSLLFWLARSACYLQASSWHAAGASAAYAAALLGPLAWMGLRGSAPGAFLAFVLMAAASLVGFGIAWKGLAPGGGARPSWRELLRDHWPYGRWVLPTAVANGIYALAYVPLLAAVAGLVAAGSFRALQNLVLPLQQALAAAHTLLVLPRLARQASSSDGAAFEQSARRLVWLALLASAAYAGVLWVGGPWLLRALYGTSLYATLGWAVPPLAASAVLWGLALALSTVLRARHRPDAILWSKTAGAVALLGLGWPAVATWGLRGALWSLVAATAVECLVLAVGPGRRAAREGQPAGDANTPISSGSMTAP